MKRHCIFILRNRFNWSSNPFYHVWKFHILLKSKNNLVQGFQNNWICPWFVCRHRWLRETHLQTLNLPGRPVAGCASPALTGRLWDWSEHRYTLKGKTETMHRSLTEWRHIMGLRLDSQMEEKLKKGAWTIPSDVILGGWYDFSCYMNLRISEIMSES